MVICNRHDSPLFLNVPIGPVFERPDGKTSEKEKKKNETSEKVDRPDKKSQKVDAKVVILGKG